MVPLYKPYMPELPELSNILYSGKLAYGDYTKKFEKMLQAFFETEYVLVTNSFYTAISVAVATIGLESGDEVIMSPMACLASTQPYESENLRIIWADVNPTSGTLDPESVKKKISAKTRCIIHNHFCGYAGDIDAINQIGQDYGIPVIDDGIECFGTEYRGRKIGNCGTDVTVFSFTAVRIPNTIDGGCIIFKDKSMYEKAILIRDCGIDRTIFRDELGEINPDCDISLRGYSATMSNVNAYIGINQMEKINEVLLKQRQNASCWDEIISRTDYKKMSNNYVKPNYWVYGLLAPNKRETIIKFRDIGYYASGVHINNNRYSIFDDKSELPGVNDFYNHFVAIPCGWWVNLKEVNEFEC